MDSGDDSSSSDDSGSDTGPVASSATTPTCAISPGSSSPNEGKMENIMIGGGSAGGPVAATLNLYEHRSSGWLDIDQFSDSDLGLEDRAAEDRRQKMGNIEDKTGSSGAEDGQAGGRSQEVDHSGNGAGDGPRDEDRVEHGGEATFADPEMDSIVDGDGPHSKGDHRAGVGGDAEGWYYPRVSFVSELTLQFQESRTRPTAKPFKLQCTPLLAWPVEVRVDLAAADL